MHINTIITILMIDTALMSSINITIANTGLVGWRYRWQTSTWIVKWSTAWAFTYKEERRVRMGYAFGLFTFDAYPNKLKATTCVFFGCFP